MDCGAAIGIASAYPCSASHVDLVDRHLSVPRTELVVSDPYAVAMTSGARAVDNATYVAADGPAAQALALTSGGIEASGNASVAGASASARAAGGGGGSSASSFAGGAGSSATASSGLQGFQGVGPAGEAPGSIAVASAQSASMVIASALSGTSASLQEVLFQTQALGSSAAAVAVTSLPALLPVAAITALRESLFDAGPSPGPVNAPAVFSTLQPNAASVQSGVPAAVVAQLAVPEPPVWSLLAIALLAVLWMERRGLAVRRESV